MDQSNQQILSDANAHAISSSVSFLVDAWPKLPPHIREAIFTLVDAALLTSRRQERGQ